MQWCYATSYSEEHIGVRKYYKQGRYILSEDSNAEILPLKNVYALQNP